MMDFKALSLLINAALVVTHLPLITVYGEEILSFQVIQPTGNIYVGDQVQLQCVISGFVESTDSVLIFIRDDSGLLRTLATDDGRYHEAPQNVQSLGIQQNSILSVTINDIDETFRGRYTCYISKIGVGTILDQDDLTLIVLLPPPICSTTPTNNDLIFNDMDEIRLTCNSETGNPPSILLWNLKSETAITLPPADTTSSSDTVTSAIDLILSTNYDGTIFTCLRESDLETCTIGPLKVRSGLMTTVMTVVVINTANTNSTDDPAASMGLQGGNIGAIVGGVLCIIIFLIIVIIIVVWLVRSGKWDLFRSRKKSTSKSGGKLEIMLVNSSETAAIENGNNNPANVPHVLSPNGGQVYAVVQKTKPQEEVRVPNMPKSTVKDYPQPPSYPRPAKRRESEEEGEHYANAGLLGVNSAADKNTERKRSSIPEEIRVASSPNTSVSIDDSNTVVYANASDVVVGNGNRKSSSPSNRMSGDNQTVYANASEAIASAPLSPAPSSPPPAPPGSPGLEYADLDLVRPPSVGTSNSGVISSDDPVMYASVKP